MNYGRFKTESLISLYFEQEYACLSYEESGRMWNKIGVIFFNLTIVGLLSWWISQVRWYPFLPLIETSVWLRDKLGLDVPKGSLYFSFLLSFFFIEFFHTIHFDLHVPFPSSFQILPTPHPTAPLPFFCTLEIKETNKDNNSQRKNTMQARLLLNSFHPIYSSKSTFA